MKQKIKVISKPGKAGFSMCLHHVKMKKMKKKNACTQIINTMITKIVITEHKN